MSLQIPCPNCGLRPVEEFAYGEIFDIPDHITSAEERDLERGFMHTNREGVVTEAWFHTLGCRRWVRINRDTRNDQIIKIDL